MPAQPGFWHLEQHDCACSWGIPYGCSRAWATAGWVDLQTEQVTPGCGEECFSGCGDGEGCDAAGMCAGGYAVVLQGMKRAGTGIDTQGH
jgi:hypothetical protein